MNKCINNFKNWYCGEVKNENKSQTKFISLPKLSIVKNWIIDLGTVAEACDSSYLESRASERIKVCGQVEQKFHMNPSQSTAGLVV
jgi:hypothetical protein